eukprot:GSMAST32.ASY1.ANO1.466.1 assembled CDS
MLVVHLLPKLTTVIPSSLVAIGVAIGVEHVSCMELKTPAVEDIAKIDASFSDMVPFWVNNDYDNNLPNFFNSLDVVFPKACILAFIGLVESLMTQQLLNDMTGVKGNPSRECIGQGIGNVMSGMFGGMGGCAMIGQSMINAKSGGISRVSSISASFFLFLAIMVMQPLINIIPTAGLVGVMFMVVIHTFEWYSFKLILSALLTKKGRDALITIVTIFTDLAIAVLCGVIISALSFAC